MSIIDQAALEFWSEEEKRYRARILSKLKKREPMKVEGRNTAENQRVGKKGGKLRSASQGTPKEEKRGGTKFSTSKCEESDQGNINGGGHQAKTSKLYGQGFRKKDM